MPATGERHLVSITAANLHPRKAAPIRLPPHISGASAFRRIILACLTHLIENEPVAIAGVNDEGIHQARVAIRRLRSALALFRDYAGTTALLDFQGRLRELAAVLGEARDWDVFLAEIVPAYRAARPAASLGAIESLAIRLRTQAHQRVRRTLTDSEHHALLADIEHWIKSEDWRAGLGLAAYRDLDGFCRDLAAPLLDRAAKRVTKRGRNIVDQMPEERHELRKTMKKLRYAVEFLATLYPPKRVHRYLAATTAVQDVLGKMNDAAATTALLDRLVRENGRRDAEFDAFRDWSAAGHADDLFRLAKAWSRFEAAKPFWR